MKKLSDSRKELMSWSKRDFRRRRELVLNLRRLRDNKKLSRSSKHGSS
jgi:hypothetical protein